MSKRNSCLQTLGEKMLRIKSTQICINVRRGLDMRTSNAFNTRSRGQREPCDGLDYKRAAKCGSISHSDSHTHSINNPTLDEAQEPAASGRSPRTLDRRCAPTLGTITSAAIATGRELKQSKNDISSSSLDTPNALKQETEAPDGSVEGLAASFQASEE
jgi:hypothetical protein